MTECIMIAIVGALINLILALIIPCLLKNTQQHILVNIKKVYAVNKQVIITSTIIVFITIYLALKITPELGFSFNNEISINPRNMDMPFNSRNMDMSFDSRNIDMSLDSRNVIESLFKSPSNNGFRIVNLSKL